MSVRVMGAIWQHSPHKGSELLLLLAIADNANDQGVAWPGQETLAEKTRMSVRQVRRLSQSVEDAGAMWTERKRDGSKTHIIYHLNVPTGQDVPPESEFQPDISVVQPDIAVSAEPSIEPSEDQEQDLRPIAASPRTRADRDSIWDALTDVFGPPLTRTAESLRGRIVSSLLQAGATAAQIRGSREAYRERMPAGTTFTETALEKHWSLLQLPVEAVKGSTPNMKYGRRDVTAAEMLAIADRLEAEERRALAAG